MSKMTLAKINMNEIIEMFKIIYVQWYGVSNTIWGFAPIFGLRIYWYGPMLSMTIY
jgi:hypothetical protein